MFGWLKKDDKGSTLITVVVGVSFLMILAAVLLATSSAGLRMKQMEYAATRSHYSDERVLDDVYNGIGRESARCLSQAYMQILSLTSSSEGEAQEALYKNQSDAYKAFARRFQALMQVPYKVCRRDDADDTVYLKMLKELSGYLSESETGTQRAVTGFREIEWINDGEIPYQLAFRDITVQYSTGGLEAFITTDIIVEIPYLNFFQDSSRILDYALIANKGIYFDGSDAATVEGRTRSVVGNVYAGMSIDEPMNKERYPSAGAYGGLYFYQSVANFESHYLISKGDINVRKSNVTVKNDVSSEKAQVWAESIRTVEEPDRKKPEENDKAVLHIDANTYAANDLELNAWGSEVTLSGEYYGYNNNGAYATKEYEQLASDYASPDKLEHTNSSAIIINGNESQLTLSDLSTLVVAGRAYVDLQSRAYSDISLAKNIGGNEEGKKDEIATGESLALKTNQYLYLAPTSCLKTTNPVKTYSDPSDPNEPKVFSEDEVWKDSGWFGSRFIVFENEVIAKTILNRTTGVAYTYYYLNFQSPKARDSYVSAVLNMQKPEDVSGMEEYADYTSVELEQIWKLKQSLEKKMEGLSGEENGEESLIEMADATTASIYGEGIISSTNNGTDGNRLGSFGGNSDNTLSTEYVSKMTRAMPRHYEWLYTELDPKEQFALTFEALQKPPKLTQTGMPAAAFVDFSKVTGKKASYRYQQNNGYETRLVPAGGNGEVTANFKGIIICDGDVTIKSGVDVQGLVIASGRIYVEGNGTISADRAIVQSILEEEQTESIKHGDGWAEESGYALSVLKGMEADYVPVNITNRVTGTEYTDYISYQNWRKSEGD